MKLSDILRELIDKLADLDTDQSDDTDEVEDTADEQPVMMPPQTQKLELLKKAVGVESAYDEAPEEECQEIATLRRNAGVNPSVIDALGDDTLE